MNTGGGVKFSLIGPLRVRADYRVFTLKGDPLHDVVHRIYVGANLTSKASRNTIVAYEPLTHHANGANFLWADALAQAKKENTKQLTV